jgi:hypothetical protein
MRQFGAADKNACANVWLKTADVTASHGPSVARGCPHGADGAVANGERRGAGHVPLPYGQMIYGKKRILDFPFVHLLLIALAAIFGRG